MSRVGPIAGELAGVGETADRGPPARCAPSRRRARPVRSSIGGERSVVETIACRLPMKTRRPRSRLSARSSFSGLPSRCATLRAAPSTSTASAASAPALRARAIRSSSNETAVVGAAAAARRGASGLLRCDLPCRPGFRLCCLWRRSLLAGRRLLRSGAFSAALRSFGVGRARLRAGAFRLAVFLLGGIAGSLAGGADRLGGAAGRKAQARRGEFVVQGSPRHRRR